MTTTYAQFFGKSQGRSPGSKAIKNEQDATARMAYPRENGPGKQVEYRTARATTIIEYRSTMSIVSGLPLDQGMKVWTPQAIRMQHGHQALGTPLFVQEVINA